MATDRVKPLDPEQEAAQARALAARYRCEFVDLAIERIDHELFRSIPVDLMFRYNFVPMRAENGSLDIALADPRNLNLIDELAILLNKKLRVKVATLSQIAELLKRTEQSQRVLEEVTEGFALDVVGEEEGQDETLSIDRLTAADSNIAPVIKLVDTTIFNALERRASDIHIETRDQEVAIKYRIDGVLHYAMPPIAKDWHSTILSRIKVMSELDIAERRIPQDGRFKVSMRGHEVDFRVSIMPSIFGEDAVLRILDKQTLSDQIKGLRLSYLGFDEHTLTQLRRLASEAYGMLLVTGPTGSGKTTVTSKILDRLDRGKVVVLQHDSYYKDLAAFNGLPVEQINFDHPDALETSLLIAHLRQLKNCQSISQPLYDYTSYRRSSDVKIVEPKSVVIVEGILIFDEKELRDLMDIKIFVDTDADERLLRRLKRDLLERHRSIESVMRQYVDTVKPMHLEFVEPSKRWADIIIPKGGENVVAIDMVVAKIEQLLHSR